VFDVSAIKVERLSVAISPVGALLAFPCVCALSGAVVRALIIVIVDQMTANGVQIVPPYDDIIIGTMIGLALLLAYIVSRTLYTWMRWQTIDNDAGKYCVHCGYDLTGNVSGRCPECGEPR
jgi:hypothetical protein